MARRLRYLPPGAMVEVTNRTLRNFFLLPVTPHFARVVVGILALAQEKYPVEIHAVTVLSTHFHLLLTPKDHKQLSRFMEFVDGNIAREACRLVEWDEKFWGDRYHAVAVSPEPEAQIGRLRYVLAHGVKEGLVERVRDWEGLHCGPALMDGKPLAGVWYNRSLAYEANRQGKDVDVDGYMNHYTLKLTPMPCWKGLPPAKIRALVTEMVIDIEAEAAAERAVTGREVLGVEAIRRQNPQSRPVRPKKSPLPLVHAVSPEIRKRMKEAYRAFVEAFRNAADLLKSGNLAAAAFPKGCFPPSLPFTRRGETFDPFADLEELEMVQASPGGG